VKPQKARELAPFDFDEAAFDAGRSADAIEPPESVA